MTDEEWRVELESPSMEYMVVLNPIEDEHWITADMLETMLDIIYEKRKHAWRNLRQVEMFK